MNVIIITGTSRGLGEAIAHKLIAKDNQIFCISRKTNENLMLKSQQENCHLKQVGFDLNNLDGVENLMDTIFDEIDFSLVRTITLVNNAGVVSPIKPIERCTSQEITNSISVNLMAPMILTSLFIQKLEEFSGEKRIINISSGAGKKPYHGWSCYCSSKAAIDLFTQCVGKEQQVSQYPTKIMSFGPGIMDTDMQAEIRQTSEKDFNQVERFMKFKEENQLSQPSYVADKIIEIIVSETFQQGGVIDISDLVK